jgi:hypothetical protein
LVSIGTAVQAPPELAQARAEQLASFTHFLDIPILLVIVSLGALRPSDWTQFVIGHRDSRGGGLVAELLHSAPLPLGRRRSFERPIRLIPLAYRTVGMSAIGP